MTLIFSNENRILFNIENSDQLLELSYGNRLTALLHSKKLYKQKYTSYKIYLAKHVTSNFITSANQEKSICTYKSSIYNTPIAIRTNQRFVSESLDKLQIQVAKPPNRYKKKLCMNADLYLQRSFVRKVIKTKFLYEKPYTPDKALFCKQSRTNKVAPLHSEALHEKHFEIEKDENFTSHSKTIQVKIGDLVFFFAEKAKLLHFVFCSSFTNDYFNSLKEKIKTVKVFVPKVEIWSFALSSSFLLVSMSSILQRHEQNRWVFTLSKKQMPGLYLTSQESSWECFENITLKYLNRKSLPYKHSNCKDLVKNINCYKDILYLDFFESWNQQFIQNYTAVFSKYSSYKPSYIEGGRLNPDGKASTPLKQRFVHKAISYKKLCKNKKICTNNRMQSFLQIFDLYLQGRKKLELLFPQKKRILSSKILDTNFAIDNFTEKKTEKKALYNKVRLEGEMLHTFIESNCKSGCNKIYKPIKNQWAVQPWYQIHARVAPKKIIAKKFGSKNKCKKNTAFTNFFLSINLRKSTFFTIRGYKEQINDKNDSIPAKISCSKKNNNSNKNFIYSPNDILKNLFYKSGSFSINSQALQTPAQDIDSSFDFSLKKGIGLEKLIDSNRLSFLQEESFFKDKTHFKSQYNVNPLYQLKRENSLNKRSQTKFQRSYRSYQSCQNSALQDCQAIPKPLFFFCKASFFKTNEKKSANFYVQIKDLYAKFWTSNICKQNVDLFHKNNYTNLKPSLSKSTEKLFSYLLYKRNSISNRFMSGYRVPEINKLQVQITNNKYKDKNFLSCKEVGFKAAKPSYSIKVPPALPFYGSKIKGLHIGLHSNTTFLNDSFNSLINKTFDFKNKQLLSKAPRLCLFNKSNKRSKAHTKFVPVATSQALKKMPYRKLCLNEFQEVKSLFEQVNKTFRVSPYRFAFNNSLFSDYNDYLSWPKDTAAAISISPSLEEEEAIKKSWNEHLFLKEQNLSQKGGEKNALLNQNLEKSLLQNQFVDSLERQAEMQPALEIEDLYEDLQENLYLQAKQKEKMFSTPEGREQLNPQNGEERLVVSPVLGEEEDKKREITKFEWLQQVREAEQLVEKRKDFQKLAYPNKEALLSKRLKVQPGIIENLLVSDRKLSFFGIPNLFPKRLIAQDQREINSQILRDEQNRRSISLLEQINFKEYDIDTNSNSLFTQDSKKRIFVEDLLKSGALFKIQKSNGFGSKHKKIKEDLRFSHTNAGASQSEALYAAKPILSKGIWRRFVLVRTVPRNRQKNNGILGAKLSCIFNARQHPIYTPNRRLRLRIPQSSFSSQNNNSQARIDDLNISQSHRWWQKRRITPNLLGTPSKRYLVMPEITSQDWKKIVQWQLKTYFLEEEKRLEPLVLEKKKIQKTDFAGNKEIPFDVTNNEQQTKHFFKVKKIAIFLPWTTLKKSIKKPFEWPLTGLSAVQTKDLQEHKKNNVRIRKSKNLQFAKPITRTRVVMHQRCKETLYQNELQSFIKNKKPDFCFVSSISPNFKTSLFFLANPNDKAGKPPNLTNSQLRTNAGGLQSEALDALHGRARPFGQKFVMDQSSKEGYKNSLCKHDITKKQLYKSSVYKPFLFEGRTTHSYLLVHQLLLAIAIKQFFQSIYKIFGKVIVDKIKNSSLAIVLLPIFFNTASHSTQIPEFYNLKKRLKDLVGNEDTISSLSEIVWYLRNSCRGRMIPRGVVLVETLSSESTNFLKAIGGEAQVPVIVQSLRALPFTQNHPQRRLEKILTFAQKRAPCILFLDDLDSIGQSRTLLLKNNYDQLSTCKSKLSSFSTSFNHRKQNVITKASEKITVLQNKLYNFTIGNGERFEKKKWSKEKNNFDKKSAFLQQNLKTNCKSTCANLWFSCTKGSCRYTSSHKSKICACTPNATRFLSSLGRGSKASHFIPNELHVPPRGVEASSYKASLCKGERNKSLISNGTKGTYLSETEKMVEQRRVDLMLRLLTVMDGISHLNGVLIVTTSKNPASLDPALLRPGRFEKLINLKLPNKKKRIELLKMQIAKIGHTNPMPWEYFGAQTQDMTGTEIASAINHSAFRAIIQSTVHTFPTLEYGIGCVNGDKSSLMQSEALRKRNNFSQVQSRYKTSCKAIKSKLETNNNQKSLTANKKFAFSLKQITVHNPYKTFARFSTQICKSRSYPVCRYTTINQKSMSLSPKVYNYKWTICTKPCIKSGEKKVIASQLSFYQAGKGVIQSLILNCFSSLFPVKPTHLISSPFSLHHKGKKICNLYDQPPNTYIKVQRNKKTVVPVKNWIDRAQLMPFTLPPTLYPQRGYGGREIWISATNLVRVIHYNGGLKSEALYANEPFGQNFVRRFVLGSATNLIGTSFAQNIIRLYAGQASELLYLDSTAYLKNKVISKPVFTKQGFALPFFLQSNFSYRDRIEAASIIENITSNFRFYQKSKSLINVTKHIFVSPPKRFDCIAEKDNVKLCFTTPVKNIRFLSSTNFYKNNCCTWHINYINLRKYLQFNMNNDPENFVLFYDEISKNSFWSQKISETLKIFKRPTGNWYRLYLPKIEQNKNNREWLLPDQFFNQHISILKQDLIMQNFVPEKTKDCVVTHKDSYKNGLSHSALCQKLYPAQESCTDLTYYNMVLSSFYVAFQNCSENRELLDFLADHLIRFKILRLHEIIRIASFYF